MGNKLHNKSDDPVLEARLQDLLLQAQGLYHTEIDLSLQRVEVLLEKLNNPHLGLPSVVHIAGTNGKGSTLAILRALLEHSGKRVHVMTSPHLVHPTERIRLAGDLISTQNLIDVLEETLRVNDGAPITYFEILTVASFLAMARVDADFTLLETGMGGRFDATNVVPNPVCTIITSIAKDHQEFLGTDLKQIAMEKAGIMKSGVPCIVSKQSDEALRCGVLDSFHQQSQALSPEAHLVQYGEAWNIEPCHDDMQFTWRQESIVCPKPSLVGEHQLYNAGAAMATYRVIMVKDEASDILSTGGGQKQLVDALASVEWPGRLQKIEDGGLVDMTCPSQELWIDGGHNADAGRVLAMQAKQWQKEDNRPLVVVLGMVKRKDPAAFLKPLEPYMEHLVVMEIPGEPESYSAEALKTKILGLDIPYIETTKTIYEALNGVKDIKNARILVTGSLYFLGKLTCE